MKCDGVVRSHAAKNIAGLSAVDHEVFRDGLGKVDLGLAGQKVGVMRFAQAKTVPGKFAR